MLEIGKYSGTGLYTNIIELDNIYSLIENEQKCWREKSPAQCPQGCGCCCEDFEPDVLEIEALYLAVWMFYNQKEKAEAILNQTFISPRELCGNKGKGCFLFDPNSEYHCTVYDGRTLICRLFGFSGDKDKNGQARWKPCRFIPQQLLKDGIEHRQYTAVELKEKFGVLPPVMVNYLTQAISIEPDCAGETEPLHIALVKALKKVKMIQKFLSPDTPEPEPNSPMPSPCAA